MGWKYGIHLMSGHSKCPGTGSGFGMLFVSFVRGQPFPPYPFTGSSIRLGNSVLNTCQPVGIFYLACYHFTWKRGTSQNLFQRTFRSIKGQTGAGALDVSCFTCLGYPALNAEGKVLLLLIWLVSQSVTISKRSKKRSNFCRRVESQYKTLFISSVFSTQAKLLLMSENWPKIRAQARVSKSGSCRILRH